MSGIRNVITGALACAVIALGGAAAPASAQRSEAQVNAIIKSLAPIRGQAVTKGYKARRKKSWRTLVIGKRRVIVDYDFMVDFEVYFPYDSARLTRRARAQLWGLGRALQSPELAPFSYVIAGHTDARGSRAYNRKLSWRRAAAVRGYLIRNFGIDPERLLIIGFGEDSLKDARHPFSPVNRRVEVVMIVPAPAPMARPPVEEEPADIAPGQPEPEEPADVAPPPPARSAPPPPPAATPNAVLRGRPPAAPGALPPCTREELQDLDDYQRKPGVDCQPPPGWKPKR